MNIFTGIRQLDLPAGEYVVLGSGVLAALGIRDVADIDLLVSPRLFNQLRQRGWEYGTLDYDGHVRERLTLGEAEAFKDFWYSDQNPAPEKLIADAAVIKGVPFLPLATLLDIKRALNRPKDHSDIALIEKYLARHNGAMPQRAAVVIVENGKVLLVHRFKGGLEYWVLPGGSVEAGESLEQACRREAKEETGLDILIVRRVLTREHEGRSEAYFLARAVGGKLEVVEPERSRQSPSNRYTLEWVEAAALKRLSVHPAQLEQLLKKEGISE